MQMFLRVYANPK